MTTQKQIFDNEKTMKQLNQRKHRKALAGVNKVRQAMAIAELMGIPVVSTSYGGIIEKNNMPIFPDRVAQYAVELYGYGDTKPTIVDTRKAIVINEERDTLTSEEDWWLIGFYCVDFAPSMEKFAKVCTVLGIECAWSEYSPVFWLSDREIEGNNGE
jgi:hypothetical protein